MNKINLTVIILIIFLFNQVIKLNANDDTYINSNNITYNEKENIIELSEDSKINFKDTNILIDKGIIDYDNNEFEVFGNFYLYEELTILSGQNLKGNTSLDVFSANNVSFIYNDDLKIDSDLLDKNKDFLYFYNNFLTPCDLDGFFNCPTWSLRIDKTKYDIEKDKFTHFDTFFQIADYKVFYLPYFTHYGTKAPRQKGFLTPSVEFTVGGDQGIIAPYYLPLSQSTDLLFKPKIYLNPNFDFLNQYKLHTLIENKKSGGETFLSIDNIKNKDNENINTTFKVNTKQVINENNIISASGLFTNSISTSRSLNEEPVTFENIYIRSENYNFFKKNDYLKFQLESIETFESTNFNTIPILPSLNYINYIQYENSSLINEIDVTILKRSESTAINPSDGFRFSINNEIESIYFIDNLSINNKLFLNNNYSDYYFNKDQKLNHYSYKSNLILSSDFTYQKFDLFTPRTKIVIPLQLINTNKNINEDSQSITFNYQNQFSETRFFGNDLPDSTPRFVIGLENNINISGQEISLNINQSYDTNKNNSYANKINQNSKFSDYSIEAEINNNKFVFKIDSRVDKDKISKKEMNYSLFFQKPINLSLNYNETQAEAFKNLSNDTQSINLEISKSIYENLNLSYNSNLDVKNNYDPYKSSFKMSLNDECSQLDIIYSNTRFNDNFNTKPEETISFIFNLDYIGFFGFEQSTDLISKSL